MLLLDNSQVYLSWSSNYIHRFQTFLELLNNMLNYYKILQILIVK